jgi:hypothetical protein
MSSSVEHKHSTKRKACTSVDDLAPIVDALMGSDLPVNVMLMEEGLLLFIRSSVLHPSEQEDTEVL